MLAVKREKRGGERQMRRKTHRDSNHISDWGNGWKLSGPRSHVTSPILHPACSERLGGERWGRSMCTHHRERVCGCMCVYDGGMSTYVGTGMRSSQWTLLVKLLWCQRRREIIRPPEKEWESVREGGGSGRSSNTVSRKCCWGFSIFLAFQSVEEKKNHVR